MAGIYRYTDEELASKVAILIDGGFSAEQAKNLIRYGIAGKKRGGLFSSISDLFGGKSALEKLSDIRASGTRGEELIAAEREALSENGLAPLIQAFSDQQGTESRLRGTLLSLVEEESVASTQALHELQQLPGEDLRYLISEGRLTPNDIVDNFKNGRPLDDLFATANRRIATEIVRPQLNRFNLNAAEAALLSENLLPKVFPENIFPKGSLSVSQQGLLRIEGEISDEALEFLKQMKPSWKSVLESADREARSPADRAAKLLKGFGIEDSSFLTELQRSSFQGDFQLLIREESWESAFGDELFREVLGVDYIVKDGKYIVDPENIPDDLLEQFSYLEVRTGSATKSSQAQTVFNELFYDPERVRSSLGSRSELVPDQVENLTHRSGNPDWQIIELEELQESANDPSKITNLGPPGTVRRIYRNENLGQSIVENIRPDGSVDSVEMIVARDPSDPTRGVTFFSYEKGKLARQFKNNSGAHKNTGFDCMVCHGARVRNNRSQMVSSFAPLGMANRIPAYDPNIRHSTVKALDLSLNRDNRSLHE